MTNAGSVKIAPAATDSPMEPAVRAMFSSRTVPLNPRSTAMPMTAAGYVAAMVIPACRPRYALAAPSTTVITTEPSVLPLPASRESQWLRPGMLALLLFSIGHFAIDMYSGAIGAFQPLLVAKLGMTLTQAGLLGGVMVFSGSFVQPAYGFLSDRFHSRMFSVLAPAVAGTFISLLGLSWNFASAALLVFLGSAGIASFHPQASAWATLGIASNRGQRGKWMAVFISAGTLGLAVGPTFFASIVQWAGSE